MIPCRTAPPSTATNRRSRHTRAGPSEGRARHAAIAGFASMVRNSARRSARQAASRRGSARRIARSSSLSSGTPSSRKPIVSKRAWIAVPRSAASESPSAIVCGSEALSCEEGGAARRVRALPPSAKANANGRGASGAAALVISVEPTPDSAAACPSPGSETSRHDASPLRHTTPGSVASGASAARIRPAAVAGIVFSFSLGASTSMKSRSRARVRAT